jgi:hypothetical protein
VWPLVCPMSSSMRWALSAYTPAQKNKRSAKVQKI